MPNYACMYVHGLEQPPIYVHSVRSRRWLNGAVGNEREQVDVALGRSKCRDLGG